MFASRKRKLVAIVAAVLVAVGTTAGSCGGADKTEQNDPTAGANFEAQKKSVPVPQLQDSLERRNISEHIKRNNQAERVRYIYLISQVGTVFAYYTIKGKVTSAGAQLTPTDDIVDACGSSHCPLVVQGPTDDASFGGDEGGIYFFTTDDQEVQWNGEWLLYDKPMKIDESALELRQ